MGRGVFAGRRSQNGVGYIIDDEGKKRRRKGGGKVEIVCPWRWVSGIWD